MISSSYLSKLVLLVIFFIVLTFDSVFSEDEPIDIWEKKENQNEQNKQTIGEKDITIKSPILSGDVNKITVKINEDKIKKTEQSVIGIFDPEENNFNLNMWTKTDGEDVKKILNRINELKLSKISEDLLFLVLFTNSYSPEKNLNSEEFLKIKINWLIEKKRVKDLEILLRTNPKVGKNSKAVKFLINEHLSSANIKSACEKINFIDRNVQNDYLEKFTIYCLINEDRKEEANIIFDLLRERGFEDKFFENKINFLLGITETTTQKILDNNLLNFYFSHITNDNFQYEPSDNTDKYIWQYLSSANLIQINNFEDEDIISTYEQAAAQNSFESSEIFKIYLKINFNFNQLINSREIYKNLPNYKARALIYQSTLLTDSIEKKIDLAFLLKDLFIKDKLLDVYSEELSNILKSIDPKKIPENYVELVKQNLDKSLILKIKFDNDILHRSKVIRHFLENNEKLSRTEKDFKTVYKKIKKNKKYFISIKDIVVLESLVADGVILPKDLNYSKLSSQLTVPSNLQELANQNQIGLVMLKIVEIIGEDSVRDLDPETIYFLNKILNDLNLKKIRNSILSEALPTKV
jgi:transposase